MKRFKIGVAVGLITISLTSLGQSKPKFVYCQVIGYGVGEAGGLSPVIYSEIIFGKKMESYQDKTLKAENGKKIKFELVIDAVNFMALHGWEVSQAYSVAGPNRVSHYYILKKNFDELEDDFKLYLLKN